MYIYLSLLLDKYRAFFPLRSIGSAAPSYQSATSRNRVERGKISRSKLGRRSISISRTHSQCITRAGRVYDAPFYEHRALINSISMDTVKSIPRTRITLCARDDDDDDVSSFTFRRIEDYSSRRRRPRDSLRSRLANERYAAVSKLPLIDDRKTYAGRTTLTSGVIHLSYARENIFSDFAYRPLTSSCAKNASEKRDRAKMI